MKKIILYIIILIFIILISLSRHYNTESKKTNYINNACSMLKENPDWYLSLKASEDKWKTPIHIQLGIIRQESAFKHDARPIRKNKWNEFGVNYQSSAYSYSQALNGTWKHYLKDTKNIFRKRDSFKDATDFIGWYNNKSNIKNNIGFNDPKNLYLAYHEGWRGYKNKSFNKKGKEFLNGAVKNVSIWSEKYKHQLVDCNITGEADFFFLFSMYFDYFLVVLGFILSVLSYLFQAVYFVLSTLYNLIF